MSEEEQGNEEQVQESTSNEASHHESTTNSPQHPLEHQVDHVSASVVEESPSDEDAPPASSDQPPENEVVEDETTVDAEAAEAEAEEITEEEKEEAQDEAEVDETQEEAAEEVQKEEEVSPSEEAVADLTATASPAEPQQESPPAHTSDENAEPEKTAKKEEDQPSAQITTEDAAQEEAERVKTAGTMDSDARLLQEIPDDRGASAPTSLHDSDDIVVPIEGQNLDTQSQQSRDSYDETLAKSKISMIARPSTGGLSSLQEDLFADFKKFKPKTHGIVPARGPLDLVWTFGFNARGFGGIHALGSLGQPNKDFLFYASGHVGVVLDRLNGEQFLLQGHNNAITCSCTSANRQWVATCDSGAGGMIIVWDTRTRVPVRTFFEDQLPNGVLALDMSHDAMYLVTLSDGPQQIVSLWDWTDETRSTPIFTTTLLSDPAAPFSFITFHQENPRQIVTNGSSHIVFLNWEYGGSLQQQVPSTVHLPAGIAALGATRFVPGTSFAVTSTNDGKAVVWEEIASVWSGHKMMKVADCSITSISLTDEYLAFGLADGSLKFCDFNLLIVSWNDKISLGPVVSISFSPEIERDFGKTARSKTVSLEGRAFVIPDYIIGSSQGSIVHVAPGYEDWMKVVVHSQNAGVTCLSAHPSKPFIVSAAYSGRIQVWNYETRVVEVTGQLPDGQLPHCLAFSPSGAIIAVGLTNGLIIVLDSITLQYVGPKEVSEFRVAQDKILKLVFSSDSHYLAFSDAEKCVEYLESVSLSGENWSYTGRYRSHTRQVVDVIFASTEGQSEQRLFSLGEDRMLVEYDLQASSFDNGLVLKGARAKADQSATPTSMIWYPQSNAKESFIMTSNSQFKFKFYNGQTRMCRKTILGPVFEDHVDRLFRVPNTSEHTVVAFTANNKIGLTLLPVDGNVHKHTASIAHPSRVSGVAISNDGHFLFSAGANGAGIHVWQINPVSLFASARIGGEGLDPFLNMLDGGKDGEFLHQLEDYFYYAQIRVQGEDSMEKRNAKDVIPISEVPSVFRALGYFLSEQEINDLLNEIKFSEFAEMREFVETVNVAQLIQLYVNHRPAKGVSQNFFSDVFHKLTNGSGSLDAADLVHVLMNKGEKLSDSELARHLTSLLGTSDIASSLQGSLDASKFTREVLGFM